VAFSVLFHFALRMNAAAAAPAQTSSYTLLLSESGTYV
jgi:hypothetical protein